MVFVFPANKITELSGLHAADLPCLRVLDLSSNLLSSTAGINLPHLQRLYLSSNKLRQCDDIKKLSKLSTLHLRSNLIASLDGFAPSEETLMYVNLRSNPLEDLEQLNKLKCLPQLRTLVLLGIVYNDCGGCRSCHLAKECTTLVSIHCLESGNSVGIVLIY